MEHLNERFSYDNNNNNNNRVWRYGNRRLYAMFTQLIWNHASGWDNQLFLLSERTVWKNISVPFSQINEQR